MDKATFYITTPVYYINDKPHIGHAYSTIAADVLARYHRGQGKQVFFLTGTDENGQKTVNAAQSAGITDVQEYADKMSDIWRNVWQRLGISFDDFIRTTEKRHQAAVIDFVTRVQQAGDIYKGEYEGLYCVGCEAFIREEDLVDGKCPDHNQPPEHVKEENYFFKLSKYQQPLLEHIKAHPEFIQPESRRNETISFIERGLEDISISRKTRKWGIPFPGDDSQVVYVWFDALINYLSAIGYPDEAYKKLWPADVHLVGKDIIKFHGTIWPAMLLSAGLPLPKTVVAHGFFTIDGKKISKSLGNAIDPVSLVNQYGIDPVRYYLLREIPFGSDGDFSHQRFLEVYNSDLANELGNLVQRTTAMVNQYLGGVVVQVPEVAHDITPYHEAIANFRFDLALEEIWLQIKSLNQYIEEEKPWQLVKQDDKSHLNEVLAYLVGNIRYVSHLLEPFLPETSAKISTIFASSKLEEPQGVLFPKFDGAKRHAAD